MQVPAHKHAYIYTYTVYIYNMCKIYTHMHLKTLKEINLTFEQPHSHLVTYHIRVFVLPKLAADPLFVSSYHLRTTNSKILHKCHSSPGEMNPKKGCPKWSASFCLFAPWKKNLWELGRLGDVNTPTRCLLIWVTPVRVTVRFQCLMRFFKKPQQWDAVCSERR